MTGKPNHANKIKHKRRPESAGNIYRDGQYQGQQTQPETEFNNDIIKLHIFILGCKDKALGNELVQLILVSVINFYPITIRVLQPNLLYAIGASGDAIDFTRPIFPGKLVFF